MSKLSDCQDHLVARLQSIAELGQARVAIGSTPEDIANHFKGIKPPMVGVIYEGMRAQGEVQGTPQGRGTTAIFACYLMVNTPGISNNTDQIGRAMDILDKMRSAVLGQRTPAGHLWRFVYEAFVDSAKGTTLWVQRWETAVINEVTQ